MSLLKDFPSRPSLLHRLRPIYHSSACLSSLRKPSLNCSTRLFFSSILPLTPGRIRVKGPRRLRSFGPGPLRPTAPPNSTAPPSPIPSLFLHTTATKRTVSSPISTAMAEAQAQAQTQVLEQLASQVQGLSLGSIAETYPNSYPKINPLDLWRAHICNVLSGISGVSTEIISRAISWTSGLDKGDFIVAVPALRVKGAKPDVLAAEWVSKVFSLLTLQPLPRLYYLTDTFTISGPKMTLSSRSLWPMPISWLSLSRRSP